jgi:hypothetical protein
LTALAGGPRHGQMADKFVVVGGVASAGHATYGPYLASVLALDADAGAWSMLPDLPVPLQGMACAASPGRVCH